ncbi:MAG: CotH kinase family protein [Ruminococcus sp.]|jgi:spore coat protein H
MEHRVKWMLLLILQALFLFGCASSEEDDSFLIGADETYETENPDSYEVKDNKALYEEGEDVVTMYLTVGRGNEEDGTDHSWTEVNSYPLDYYEENQTEPYKCEAVLQIGDDRGPIEGEFGYGERAANSTVQLRGQGASSQQQKSYRIKIKDGKGRWEDQKTISLNKHLADPVRFKNRLAYSLMEEIPQMLGARTQFVHLYVKDKTEGEDGLFRDYGLYTQVEQVNRTYLKNRNLDSDGSLYQAGEYFDWQRHEDSILPATDPDYDANQFEQYLEIDGSEDHGKIIEMLEAVNNPDNSIEEVTARYFNEDNLYYWMAFHILMGNKDVLQGNYYLYSPRGVDQWYFISWDNDSVLKEGYEFLRDHTYERSWNYGIFTYADTVLFRRILQSESCRQLLDEAVEDLMSRYLTEEILQEKIDAYKKIVKEYLYVLPDSTFARVTEEDYDILSDSMAEEVRTNYENYKKSMNSVWPFHILDPVNRQGKVILSWEDAYQFEEGDPAYSVELSKDYSFGDNIINTTVGDNSYEAEDLPPGQYFLRVRAEGTDGTVQDAYEYYRTESGSVCYSTLCFYILEDGSAAAVEYSGDD